MSGKDRDTRIRRIAASVNRYLVFFLLMAFVITCCMLLFLETMNAATGLELSEEMISRAAKLTFLNILFLSLICTVIDGVRRRYMVERPVRQIVTAAEKIMQGDLSARIQLGKGPLDRYGDFCEVVEYFNKMAEELSGIETLRTDFISNVSHELKTPLAVMQNYATMLQQPDLPEEKRIEYAKSVGDASRRLADLIANILKLNKLENQQIFPDKRTFNLGEQLCGCLLNFENIWESKDLNIDTDIEDDVYVEADSELLTLVWNNLFSNAMKFTEPGGSVSLRLQTDGGAAVVQVSDTGCGISPEVGAHIFEKFYQGDTSHAAQGNGLGLALVKRVVDINGGDISVESSAGVGSTFTVRLGRVSGGTG